MTISLQDLIYREKNFLSKEECDTFINFFESRKITSYSENSYNVRENKQFSSNFRVIEVFEDNPCYVLAIDKINLGLEKWLLHLDRLKIFPTYLMKQNLLFPHKVRILKYLTNQSIHLHSDWDDFHHASIVFNLNDNYEGGDFCFFNQGYKCKLDMGEVMIFPAEHYWLHEVTPITKGIRYSVNSFIVSVPYKDMQQIKEIKNKSKPILKKF